MVGYGFPRKLDQLYNEFTYCWEEDNKDTAFKRAKKIAYLTKELYVIGYPE